MATLWKFALLVALAAYCLYRWSISDRNHFDPHPFPGRGPFFEGWYLRFSDPTENVSLGLIIGTVLPEDHALAEKLAFVGLLLGKPGSPLATYDHFPDVSNVTITTGGGEQVTTSISISNLVSISISISILIHEFRQ